MWLGLTSKLVRKYLSKSVTTVQGHLHQERKIQDQHKSQSKGIPVTQKLVLSLQQSWIQEEYTQTKHAVLQLYKVGELIMHLSYTHILSMHYFWCPSIAERERVSYRHTQHSMATSIRLYLSQKYSGLIMRHPRTQRNKVGTRK